MTNEFAQTLVRVAHLTPSKAMAGEPRQCWLLAVFPSPCRAQCIAPNVTVKISAPYTFLRIDEMARLFDTDTTCLRRNTLRPTALFF